MIEQKQSVEEDRAYLVGWINSTIKSKFIQISSLDQLTNGVVFCQLLNILYPGKVPLSKVFIKPKGDYEILENFKLFSMVSEKLGLKILYFIGQFRDSFKLSKGRQSDMILVLLYLKKHIQSKQRTGNLANLELSNLQSSVMLYKTASPARSAKGSSRVKQRISVSPPSRMLASQLLPPLAKKTNPLEQEIEKLTQRKNQLNQKLAQVLKIVESSGQTNLQKFKQTLLKSIKI